MTRTPPFAKRPVRVLPPLVLASVMLAVTSGRAAGTPADEARFARFSRIEPVSEPESPGSLLPAASDTARKYHVRLTYTWSGEDPCMKGTQILEGEVQEELDEDGGGFFGGVLKLTADYVRCGETAVGNRACLQSVKIKGQARFGGSMLTEEDLSGVDWEGKRIAAGEMVFHWKPIDERTKVSLSGNCPQKDDSDYLPPDYEIHLHFHPPPAGQHTRVVLRRPEDWHGAGIVLDVWAGKREVVAIPRVASPVVRARPVTLDGTASKGEYLRYEWTFAARDCPPGTGHRNAKKTGPSPTVILLCSMNVTLTVTGGSLTDSKTIPVTVIPRDPDSWTTPFAHSDDEQGSYIDRAARPLVQRGAKRKLDRLTFAAGRNVCAKHFPAPADHTLDPLLAPTDASWDGAGYELAQVNDPGGPFHGYWYVAAHSLSVQRRTLMSGYLLPGGRAAFQGAQPFYETNKKAGTRVDGFLAAMRAHEGITDAKGTLGHSGLIRKQLREADPARVLERIVSREDRKALRDKADVEILRAEEALCEASKDPLPVIWEGEILFPYAGSGEYTRLRVTVGGPNYGQQSSCD